MCVCVCVCEPLLKALVLAYVSVCFGGGCAVGEGAGETEDHSKCAWCCSCFPWAIVFFFVGNYCSSDAILKKKDWNSSQ
jgi:hypothetical protein